MYVMIAGARHRCTAGITLGCRCWYQAGQCHQHWKISTVLPDALGTWPRTITNTPLPPVSPPWQCLIFKGHFKSQFKNHTKAERGQEDRTRGGWAAGGIPCNEVLVRALTGNITWTQSAGKEAPAWIYLQWNFIDCLKPFRQFCSHLWRRIWVCSLGCHCFLAAMLPGTVFLISFVQCYKLLE